MKIKSLFVAMLALVSFASCSQSEDPQAASETGTIVVNFGQGGTRIVDDLVANNTAPDLNNATVYLLQGTSVVGTHTLTTAEMTAKRCVLEQVSGAVNKVLVVANVPDGVTLSTTSANDIRNYAYTIASQQSTAGKKGVKHLTLMGEGTPETVTPNPVGDGHNYKEVTLTVKALVARIEVGTVKAGTGITSVTLDHVYINNYYTNGAKTGLAFHDETSNMWDWNAGAFPAYTNPEYTDANNAAVDGTGAKCYAYQVFADAAYAGDKIPHVLLCVSGIYEDGEVFTRKWVTFNKYHDGSAYITAMEQNKVYNLGAQITINAGDLTPDPEMAKIDLGINVTVTNWNVIAVTPGV